MRDADSRQSCSEKAASALDALSVRLAGPRSRLRTRDVVEKAVANALGARAARWVKVTIEEVVKPSFRKAGRGRPGPNSQYVKEDKKGWRIRWEVDAAAVKADAKTDGMFPLITNDRQLTIAEVLEKYKYQPYLEKRHQQLKSVHFVAPVFLKDESRIEALLFIHFLSLLVHALLEREIRQAMESCGKSSLNLYPEGRPCSSPTADRVLAIFDTVQRHRLYQGGRLIKTFEPNLTSLQNEVLGLLGLPADRFHAG